ncbi:MAG: hypothetical protein M3P32_03995 [Chloroflexota bacterium]|nr:hypothetical protein [Chloroflexota bacterium]
MPNDHRLAAADRGLVVVMQTRYDAMPDERLVRVTIDAVGTSYTPDSSEGRAYYAGFTFSVPAGANAVSASSRGQRLSARLGAVEEDFREVEVTFSRFVFYQESYAFQVVFDLPDIGGEPDRDLRVGSNIVAFSVLAYGSMDEPGSSVQVVLPAGFRASVQGSPMVTSSGPDGEVVLSAADLADPFDFFAYLAADRPGTFGEHHLQTFVDGRAARLWIRNWEGDPDWGTRMSDLMTDGIPVLQELIGLPYAVSGTLVVEEAAPTRLGDYAGTYDELTGKILVRYDADAFIGLHEAAHIWFNGNLFDLRWINEGWADFYAGQAAMAIEEEGSPFSLTDELLAHRIPLNEWGVPGVEDSDTEYFAYAASYEVATLIFARTDLDGLRAVWRAVANEEMSYQPVHETTPPDVGVDRELEPWQQLLDLLDERIGTAFDDIWSEWIVNDTQASLMEDRAGARDRYAELVTQATDWDLPTDLRRAMSSWAFAEAEAEIVIAGDVLVSREQIVAQAGELGLTPPGALQSAFEGDGGVAAAQEEAAMELEVLAGIAAAMDRLDDEANLFETIGLLGADPGATLESARTAFEAARLDAATQATAAAVATRTGAESAGQLRAAIGGSGVVLLGGGTLVGLRLRRRRRAAAPSAPPLEPLP